MKRDQATCFALLLALLISTSALAADWPNWRGPDRDGTTSGAGFDPAFAKGGIEIKWTADLGVGFTGITVADGKAYTAGWKDGDTTFYALDANTGQKIWSHTFATKKYDNLNVGGPSGTAAVAAGKVYHMARDGQFFCYDANSGDVLWQKKLTKDYGVKVPTWGFSGSPLILDNTVYLDIGRIIALNKTTGKEQWKTKDYGPAYSTPALITFKGKDYLAVFPASGLYILDRETGKEIAHKPWKTNYGVHAATPVVINNKFIFISSDYNTGCALVEFTGKGVETLWENKNLEEPDVYQPVSRRSPLWFRLLQTHLYQCPDGQRDVEPAWPGTRHRHPCGRDFDCPFGQGRNPYRARITQVLPPNYEDPSDRRR